MHGHADGAHALFYAGTTILVIFAIRTAAKAYRSRNPGASGIAAKLSDAALDVVGAGS